MLYETLRGDYDVALQRDVIIKFAVECAGFYKTAFNIAPSPASPQGS